MLHFPPTWMPNVSLDFDRLDQVVTFYQWTSAGGTFGWVEKDDLVVVGTYLVHHKTVPYWDVILRGGVGGYSLFLHEAVELDGFARRSVNPFIAAEQIANFRPPHAEALLAEHRLLQVIARTMGCDFTLRELIEYNPYGDPPAADWEGDWEVLAKHLPHLLTPNDQTLDPARESAVRDFYRRLGFEEVS